MHTKPTNLSDFDLCRSKTRAFWRKRISERFTGESELDRKIRSFFNYPFILSYALLRLRKNERRVLGGG